MSEDDQSGKQNPGDSELTEQGETTKTEYVDFLNPYSGRVSHLIPGRKRYKQAIAEGWKRLRTKAEVTEARRQKRIQLGIEPIVPTEVPKIILPAPEEPLPSVAKQVPPMFKADLEEPSEREPVDVSEKLEPILPEERETFRQRRERLIAEKTIMEREAAEIIESARAEVVEDRVDVSEKLQPITEPTIIYKQYTVHYTEGGVDKTKTFTSQGAATAFQNSLPKYSISYKGTDYGFQTKAEAEDYVQDIYTSSALNISLKKFQSFSDEKQRILSMQRLKPQPTVKYTVTYMTESGERTVIFDNKRAAESFAKDPRKTTGSILPAWAGGGTETVESTRNFAKELIEDTAEFLQEITESPGTYIRNVPQKIADVRQDLGEFLRDLTDLSRVFRSRGNMPTRSEVEKYFKDNPDVDMRPGGSGSPFRAKTVDEFFNRMAAMATNVGIGYTKAMTFPISMGLAPTSREYPEELVTQLITSLITISPADVLFTKSLGVAARITRADRVAVRAMSGLQRLGIRGQTILKKLLTDQTLTELETKMWEKIAGSFDVSTNQLRDTSGRLFTRFDFDDAGDIAKIVDDALTDMTGVQDWTDLNKVLTVKTADASDIAKLKSRLGVFDDSEVISPLYQDIIVKEVQRQLTDMRSVLSGLTDIDPGTNLMTRWGILTDVEKAKELGEAYKQLFNFVEENAASFGAGAMGQPQALVIAEEIFSDVGIDPDIFFESVDDIINFLANNPASGADLLIFLNEPVSATHPKAIPSQALLQEINQAKVIEIKDLLQGADLITVKDIVVDLDTDVLVDVVPDLDKDVVKEVLPDLDKDSITIILPKLDGDTLVDIIPDLDEDIIIDVIPKLDIDVIQKVLPTLDTDTVIKVVPMLDEDVIVEILPTLDTDTIIKLVPVLDIDTIIKITTVLDDDTIISVIPMLDDMTIQALVPYLETKLKEGRLEYITTNLPFEYRHKFKKARKRRVPKKTPRSAKPESYRVKFQYDTGASESDHLDAHTFREALIIARRRRKIKLIPREVEVEKL